MSIIPLDFRTFFSFIKNINLSKLISFLLLPVISDSCLFSQEESRSLYIVRNILND